MARVNIALKSPVKTLRWRALDAAHHIHPFTQTSALNAEGVRTIVKGKGVHLWDSDGKKLIDGMSGLWCTNVGYGRQELIDAATRQLKELSYYNMFFHTTHPAVVELSERLFTKLQKFERDIAVMFMVDMSGSTKGWINDAERESLVMLCEALEVLGDRYAIYGFSGITRKRCEIYRIKRFDEPYDQAVKQRIAGIGPQDYTRMGVAIRHLTALLNEYLTAMSAIAMDYGATVDKFIGDAVLATGFPYNVHDRVAGIPCAYARPWAGCPRPVRRRFH